MRWAIGALVVLTALVVGTSGGISFAAAGVQTPDDVVNSDNPIQKATDLIRARASGGVSPDRLVVAYDRALATNAAERLQARQVASAQLLHASSVLRRDVLRVSSGDAQAVAQRLKGLPGVKDAYPDHVAHATMAVNDPMYSSQWGLTDVQASTAWDTSQGQGVTVAILDCGIHTSHPDLTGKVTLEQNFTTAASTDDLCNHGTHVAGIVGANTNNGVGVAGMAPSVRLINGKVLDDTGSGFFSDIELGIQWAADNGARVINMSLEADIACPASTQTAANYAWSHGAVIVAAAGNSSLNTGAGAPANCLNVIGVGGIDSSDARVLSSNVGPGVALAAPGLSIYSTVNPDLNGGYQYEPFTGTSMASPHVAGAAALVWASQYGTSNSAVRDRLMQNADAIAGTGVMWTYGRVNAARAVGLPLQATSTPTPTPTQQGTGTTQTVDFNNLSSVNRALTGQYPSGVLDWGSGAWYVSGPFGAFSTNSASFNGLGGVSATVGVLSQSWLQQLDAYNGGTVASTITLTCAGQPTVSAVLAARAQTTLHTNWTSPCSTLTIGSSNGWDTNFDNLVLASASSGTGTATATPTLTPVPAATSTSTATPTSTPTRTPTAVPPTSTATPTSVPPTATPTQTSTPVSGATTTVTFDDLTNADRNLNGQYPSGVIDWGNGSWYLSRPWGLFTTNSISYPSATPRSASFTFVTPRVLRKIDAYDGGTVSSTITLSCAGQATVSVSLAAHQVTTITTGWTGTCTTVTVGSTNGWDTNFDNLVIQ